MYVTISMFETFTKHGEKRRTPMDTERDAKSVRLVSMIKFFLKN